MSRVLVVDDEPDHGKTVSAILARSGISVDVASHSDEALALLSTQTYDVALVDLRLPGRDGVATMHALHKLQPDLAVVILTAYPSPVTCRTALTEGAAAYLEKPFGPEALRALVTTLASRRQDDQAG